MVTSEPSSLCTGIGTSSGLSLREKMRLKAQQKLQDQASVNIPAPPSPSESKFSATKALSSIDMDDSGDDALGSLSLSRTKRQAALKRPAPYSIDPLDDATRLRRDPNKLHTSAARYAPVPVSKMKGIDSMLREQQRRMKRGTDADGFSRAEAIARSMEQERLGRMGIEYDAVDDDQQDHRGEQGDDSKQSQPPSLQVKPSNGNAARNTSGTNAKEPELTVKALSPTIPSFLWSSQSESGLTDDESERREDLDVPEERLTASLAAVGADEEQKRLALSILQRDMSNRKHSSADVASKGHIAFYRPGRTLAPVVTFFCPLPSLASATHDQGAATAPSRVESAEWDTVASHILLAGILPSSLDLDKRQIRRLLVWTGISYILEQNVLQSHLLSSFFQSLVFGSDLSPHRRQLDSAIPKASTDIVRRIPHILNRIGVNEEVLEECFPDNSSLTNVPCFTLAQRKSSTHTQSPSGSPSAEFKEFKVYLTQAERDNIVTNLARMVDVVAHAAPSAKFVDDNLTVLAGYVACMAIACAACTNFTLQSQVGCAFRRIFEAAAREGDMVLKRLQEEVCQRAFTALGKNSIAVRARVVSALPGEGSQIGAVRSFLAWCTLTDHLAQGPDTLSCFPTGSKTRGGDAVPSSDSSADAGEDLDQLPKETAHWRRTSFEPYSLDLDMLVKAIDPSDPRSPFYIPPLTVDDVATNSTEMDAPKSTQLEILNAATELVAILFRDLALQLCTFPTLTSDRSTPTLDHPDGKPLTSNTSSNNTTSPSTSKWTHALRLSLAPYLGLDPKLDRSRITAVRTVIDKLSTVNSKIRDNRGEVILRSIAKDNLQRTCHCFEYQLEMYLGTTIGGSSFIE